MDVFSAKWDIPNVKATTSISTYPLKKTRKSLKAVSTTSSKKITVGRIFTLPTVFYLPERLGIDCAELKYLYFEAVYEQLLKHYNDKRERSAEFEQVLENGKVWIISKTDMTESTKLSIRTVL